MRREHNTILKNLSTIEESAITNRVEMLTVTQAEERNNEENEEVIVPNLLTTSSNNTFDAERRIPVYRESSAVYS